MPPPAASLLGRALIVVGLLLVAAGVLLVFGDRLPFKMGRLPGDIVIKGRNSVLYFPLVTSLVASVLLSLVLWLISRLGGR